ncbi:FtsX-like permease family protein [Faecalimonas umbilicata]|uniref:FtsX-like permease family protein n=1 Tax=Faecalimonas umbilicata TaxID=1912855 RepID=UPI002ED687CB
MQQLLDAGQYRYRFAVLRKLGVEEQDIKGLVMKQLGVWFGLPVVVSIIVSAIVAVYFLQSVSVEISAYIGIGALITQVSIIIFILILLLVCYFLSTWILFRRSIAE